MYNVCVKNKVFEDSVWLEGRLEELSVENRKVVFNLRVIDNAFYKSRRRGKLFFDLRKEEGKV